MYPKTLSQNAITSVGQTLRQPTEPLQLSTISHYRLELLLESAVLLKGEYGAFATRP
jgi:hypothetical protein